MYHRTTTFKIKNNALWRQQLLKSCCVIIGISAFLIAFLLPPQAHRYVPIYLFVVVILCSGGYYLSSKGYTLPVAFTISTIVMIFSSLMPTDEQILTTAVGATLVIPACFMGVATNFRFGLFFSLTALLMIAGRAINSSLSWSLMTTTTAFIIVLVTGLLFLMDRLVITLEQHNIELKQASVQLTELEVAKERNRIARDFHDSLGAHLSGINASLRAAKAVLNYDPTSATEAITDAQRIVKEAVADVRILTDVLRNGSITNQPLFDLLNRLIERNRAARIATDLSILGTPYDLTPSINEMLYRVVQEALTNVRKHAQATQAVVQIDYRKSHVVLVVDDNGQGTDQANSGFGLVGIRERVEQLNGTLKITTAPGHGLRLEIEVPV